jgi:hypothetical protein
MRMNKKKRGFDYLLLSLTAFGGLGLEVLYAYVLEPLIYGKQMKEWSSSQNIIHWIITCITWGLMAVYLYRTAKKDNDFDLLKEKNPMMKWQYVAVVISLLYSTAISYLSWDGFKVLIEFERKGPLQFTFQYIYYAFEAVLILLIIVFAQKAFEEWIGNTKVPYGGVICGVTWGLVHMFTKQSILIGLEGLLLGFVLGAAYLFVNRDIKKAYVVVFLMFIL